jgi:hypothetical protein
MQQEEERSCPIPQCPPLTDTEIDIIAEKAAERAVTKMTNEIYLSVGKGVVTKFLYVAGALTMAFYFYLKGKGIVS